MKNLFLFLMLLLAVFAQASDKPRVAVRFKIEATAYRDHLQPNVAAVEDEAAAAVTKALNEHIHFADFGPPAGGTPAPYMLTVFLAVPDPHSEVATQPVWLFAALDGPSGSTARTRWRKFREAAVNCGSFADDECTWPDRKQFVKELEALLATPVVYGNLVDPTLRELPIINAGKFVVQPESGWVLPFRQEEMCLGEGTQLRIVNDIPTQQVTLHPKYKARVEGPYGTPPDSIFSILSAGEEQADDAQKPLMQQNPEKVVVRGVYVAKYQPFGDCAGAIPPPTAPPAAGGDQ